MNQYKNKGFTLIELLVVIAIIGILSSIVLASLNSARNKGNDAKVKSQLANARAAAEIYYATNGGYGPVVNACTDMFADSTSGLSALTVVGNYPAGTTLACRSSGIAWAMSANLNAAGAHWCVDSAGASRQISAALGDNVTSCPAN